MIEKTSSSISQKTKKDLAEKAKKLPTGPGCYLMKSKLETVIYVGKAKNLKRRVLSYFNKSFKGTKTEYLVEKIHSFDFILTNSEVEALILENNLIKKHTPKFNFRLKDDRNYPYVYMNNDCEFPRLEVVRNITKIKNKRNLIGPFTTGSNITGVVKIINKAFLLRDCTLRDFKSRKRPCLLYQIKQCGAPCVGYVEEDQYEKDLQLGLNFFQNKGEKSLKILEKEMRLLADQEDFEQAAKLRDYIFRLQEFLNVSYRNDVASIHSNKNIDIVNFFAGRELDVCIYMVRKGMLLGHHVFHLKYVLHDFDESVLEGLIQHYFKMAEIMPEKIVVNFPSSTQAGLLEKAINSFDVNKNVSRKVKVIGPHTKYSKVLKLCEKRAKENQKMRLKAKDDSRLATETLKKILKIETDIKFLECVDVAIWQGKSPTASQVVFHRGTPDKKRYRYYHLQERPEGNNDYAMLSEYIGRRVKQDFWPDVLVVDGGKGQVSTVVKALESHSINLPVVGIAKAKTKSKQQKTEERLILPKGVSRQEEIVLKKFPELFKLITSIRDEAHRFSRKLHHKSEKKRLLSSWLDQIKGIGPIAKKKILSHKNVTKETLESMTEQELMESFKLTKKQVANVKEYLT